VISIWPERASRPRSGEAFGTTKNNGINTAAASSGLAGVDAFTGGGLCQNNLETGDVVEVLTTLPTYSIAMNGMTYHPQNEALFSWFAFESPSHAHLGAYSFPDETTLTTLSQSNLLPGCTRAQ